jgi:hypothetical protein
VEQRQRDAGYHSDTASLKSVAGRAELGKQTSPKPPFHDEVSWKLIIVNGSADISRAFVVMAKQSGLGAALGVIAAALLVRGIPSMRDEAHGYTIFLALMLALFGITSRSREMALAVLMASLLIGNASSIVPHLFPGAHRPVFAASQTTAIMRDQMTFLIKSFPFFFGSISVSDFLHALQSGASGAGT